MSVKNPEMSDYLKRIGNGERYEETEAKLSLEKYGSMPRLEEGELEFLDVVAVYQSTPKWWGWYRGIYLGDHLVLAIDCQAPGGEFQVWDKVGEGQMRKLAKSDFFRQPRIEDVGDILKKFHRESKGNLVITLRKPNVVLTPPPSSLPTPLPIVAKEMSPLKEAPLSLKEASPLKEEVEKEEVVVVPPPVLEISKTPKQGVEGMLQRGELIKYTPLSEGVREPSKAKLGFEEKDNEWQKTRVPEALKSWYEQIEQGGSLREVEVGKGEEGGGDEGEENTQFPWLATEEQVKAVDTSDMDVKYDAQAYYNQYGVDLGAGWQPNWANMLAPDDYDLSELSDYLAERGFGSGWRRGDFVEILNISKRDPYTTLGLYVVDVDSKGWYLRNLERVGRILCLPRDYEAFTEFYPAYHFYCERDANCVADWWTPGCKNDSENFLVPIPKLRGMVRNGDVGRYQWSIIDHGQSLLCYPRGDKLDSIAYWYYMERAVPGRRGPQVYNSEWVRELLGDEQFFRQLDGKIIRENPQVLQIFIKKMA